MALLLDHKEAASAVTMAEAVEVLEEGFHIQARGEFSLPARLTAPAGKGWLRMMPAVLSGMGVMGFKAMNLCPGVGARYVVFLYRVVDGELLAIMDAETITTQRTGAVSAVATKFLARPNASAVGVLGSGVEARTQLEAMTAVRKIRAAKVYSPTIERRLKFAAEMSRKLGIPVEPVGSEREAVQETDLVVLAVKSKAPVFSGEWMRAGMHVNAIGSVRADHQEIDPSTFRRSDLVVVDSREEVMESGDGKAARADGLNGKDFHELWELVNGSIPGRKDDRSITLFKSVGTALQDLALANKIFEVALSKGLGQDIGDFPMVSVKT